MLTNTAVLWSGHTGHGPIVRQNYINQNKISIKMKPTPPVLIFEIIPMDLGDLGGRADGRTDGRTDGRMDGRMDGRTDGRRTDGRNNKIWGDNF